AITAVNADTMSIAIGSGTGSSGGLGTNIKTTPASITSEPSTASFPNALMSQALALPLTEPSGPALIVMLHQSRMSVPSRAPTVPPITIHMLRVTLDI